MGNFKHGMWQTDIYRCWVDMRRRCNNQSHSKYVDYGGRGIKVCDRWQDFASFYDDMGDKPEGMTLDRIDNNGDYEPSNCRWATRKEQSNNKRTTLMLTHQGTTHPISHWAEITDIKHCTIYYRVRSGWPIDKALTQRPQHKGEE